MMTLLTGLLSMALVACAEPNYQGSRTNPDIQIKENTCALKFSKSDVCVNLIWQKMPTEEDMGNFLLNFYKLEDGAVVKLNLEKNLKVVLWMPAMGHGSSPVKLVKLDDGYNAQNVFFTMPGDWQIRIQIKNESNEIEDEAIQDIRI